MTHLSYDPSVDAFGLQASLLALARYVGDTCPSQTDEKQPWTMRSLKSDDHSPVNPGPLVFSAKSLKSIRFGLLPDVPIPPPALGHRARLRLHGCDFLDRAKLGAVNCRRVDVIP